MFTILNCLFFVNILFTLFIVLFMQVTVLNDVHTCTSSSSRKRVVGRQRKNKIKGCLKGGSGRSKSSSKVAENQNEKTIKWSEAKCNVLTVESWDTGK
jgi:hypothetical protein